MKGTPRLSRLLPTLLFPTVACQGDGAHHGGVDVRYVSLSALMEHLRKGDIPL